MNGGGRSTRRLARRVAAGEDARALIDVLAAWVPDLVGHDVSRARLRALIASGAVHVGGVPSRAPAQALRAGTRVDAVLRLDALAPPLSRSDRPFTLDPARVLFEDEWLIAVDKPPGLPTHPTADPRRPSLVTAVETYLAAHGRTPYVAVHQRLDRDTSGVVLFATHPAANEGLARAFAGREAEKTYEAVAVAASPVAFPPGRTLTIDAPLAAPERERRVRVGGAGAKPARTLVTVREQAGSLRLVEAHPETGRKHQVRAHLAHVGMPVLGDSVYGRAAENRPAPRLMLHAARLALRHPISGRALRLESRAPAEFAQALERAREACRPARKPPSHR